MLGGILCSMFGRVHTRSKKNTFVSNSLNYTELIPAWDSGSEQDTLVFNMLGVTGSGPQF